MWFISRQAKGQMQGMMSVGRSKAKLFNVDRPKTTFEDVAGYYGVKQEISEVVEFLKTPARYTQIGALIPKGILLVGPEGTSPSFPGSLSHLLGVARSELVDSESINLILHAPEPIG